MITILFMMSLLSYISRESMIICGGPARCLSAYSEPNELETAHAKRAITALNIAAKLLHLLLTNVKHEFTECIVAELLIH